MGTENQFVLRERSILILGPFNSLTQSLMLGLAGHGADVALVGPEAIKGERFANQVSDQRELYAKHGRGLTGQVDYRESFQISDAIGKVAQSFGGIDVYIDAQFGFDNSSLRSDVDFDQLYGTHLRPSMMFSKIVMNYLKNRRKGRILYLCPRSFFEARPEDAYAAAFRTGLFEFSRAAANDLKMENVTVNFIELGVTEEYLMAHYPGMAIKAALLEYQKKDPYAKLMEPNRIAETLVFFISPQGATLTGQRFSLI
jgi:2-hydroxycyclohexanecarboxyl-CoA dehydrogenase